MKNLSFVDLINRAVHKKMSIGVFPIPSNAWIDLGQSMIFQEKIDVKKKFNYNTCKKRLKKIKK